MKNIHHLILGWTFAASFILIASVSFAQTDDYHCNLICVNQPDYIMEGVEVNLYDSNNEFIGSTITDNYGFFHFSNLNVGESYVAKFSYDAINGYVDLGDAFNLLDYLSGNAELTEYQLIAANVNGDSEVDYNDFITILYNYYILEQEFPVGNWILPDWEFTVQSGKATGGPQHTVSVGDIELDDDLPKGALQAKMLYPSLEELSASETIIPIYFNEKISTGGIGLVLSYNSNAIEILDIESPISDLTYHVNDGIIRIGWTGLESYKFSATDAFVNIHIKQSSTLNQAQIERFEVLEGTHILDGQGQKINGVSFSSTEFKTSAIATAETGIAYPNPCTDNFSIQLSSELNDMEVIVFNIQGQQVIKENIQGNQGTFIVNTQQLSNGMYYYQINSESKSILKPISVQSK